MHERLEGWVLPPGRWLRAIGGELGRGRALRVAEALPEAGRAHAVAHRAVRMSHPRAGSDLPVAPCTDDHIW